LEADGSLVIGLRELNNSGFTGIAFLSPTADGAGTAVSVFIAETQRGRNRGGNEAAATSTPEGAAMGGMEMASPTAEEGTMGVMSSPTAEEGVMIGMEGTPTP
jgi:hypothetical protein